MTTRTAELAAETRAAALDLQHEWDRRAIDWPLDKNSVVVEVGGYKGRWALQIAERYQPRLYVFEPQEWAYGVCCAVLGDRATVLPYGLGVEDGYLPMGEYETDGCSFIKEYEPYAACQIKVIDAVFRHFGITHIDLMLMNIEGYEYTLLPYMFERGILPCRLMVQFHTFADKDGMHLAKIYQRLEEHHYRIAWTYGVMLTAWEKN
jgi:FkbM family methyltransferase